MSQYQKNYNIRKEDSPSIHAFQDILGYSDGLIAVKQNDLFGFIDIHGKWCIPCQYEDVSLFEDGVAIMSANNLYGLIDKKGNQLLAPMHKRIHSFSEGLASFEANIDQSINNKIGFLDKNGVTIIPPQYCYTSAFHDGLALVLREEEDGYITHAVYINKQGEVVIDIENEEAYSFNDGYAILQKSDVEGVIIDTKGEIVYSWQGNFENYEHDFLWCTQGMLHIYSYDDNDSSAGLYDVINKKKINVSTYDEVFGFKNGYSIVCGTNSLLGCIDKDGRELIPCIYRELEFYDDIFLAEDGDHWGAIDIDRNVLIPFKYTYLDHHDTEYLVAETSKKLIVIDRKGDEIFVAQKVSKKKSLNVLYLAVALTAMGILVAVIILNN